MAALYWALSISMAITVYRLGRGCCSSLHTETKLNTDSDNILQSWNPNLLLLSRLLLIFGGHRNFLFSRNKSEDAKERGSKFICFDSKHKFWPICQNSTGINWDRPKHPKFWTTRDIGISCTAHCSKMKNTIFPYRHEIVMKTLGITPILFEVFFIFHLISSNFFLKHYLNTYISN